MKQLKTMLLIVAIAFAVPVFANVDRQVTVKVKPCPYYIYTYTVDSYPVCYNGACHFHRDTYGVGILGQVTLISSEYIPWIPPAPPQ